MLLPMPGPLDRTSTEKRRSFLLLVLVLVVAGVAVAAFSLSRGDNGPASSTPTSDSSGSGSGDLVTLQTACAEVPPDLALRVDALRRTADLVRADVAAMQAQGNATDAVQATLVADALESLADAQETQQGVRRATRELGQTLASVC